MRKPIPGPTCGACGATFPPAGSLPAACPCCGEPLTASPSQARVLELEALARRPKLPNDPRRAHVADPRRSNPQ